jgi:dTDP-4-amino-4,6-dideoxygalactose transaminase
MKTLKVLSNLGVFVGSSSEEELIGAKPVGYEKRMSEFQASCGLDELSHLKENIDLREKLTVRYDQLLADAGFKPVAIPPGVHAVLVRYPLLVKNKAAV